MSAFTFEEIQSRFMQAIATAASVPAEVMEQAETRLISEPDRAGSGTAVAYHVGLPTLIRTDPALVEALSELVHSSHALDVTEVQLWAATKGWKLLDGGDLHILSVDQLKSGPPEEGRRDPGVEQVTLNRDGAVDRSLIRAFLDANDPDDVDAAEFEMDDLDPHIIGYLDTAGRLVAMVSGRVWDYDEIFDDIGVMVDARHQGRGLGAQLVAAYCRESFALGRLPLYRCNWSRVASKALASSLGFRLVGQVVGVTPRN